LGELLLLLQNVLKLIETKRILEYKFTIQLWE